LGCVLMAMSRVDPERIAPKILTGRFERKIFVDNPNGAARKAMILRQLADEDSAHMLTPEDVGFLVEKTAGRIRQKRVSLLCRMRQTPRRWQRRAHESVAVGLPPSYGWNV
jgi:SpoVK/Ycf46/Vps4 family AAA+-type ATPase